MNWFDKSDRAWRPIDTALGSSQEPGTAFKSGSNRFSAEVGKTGSDPLLTFVDQSGSGVAVSLDGSVRGASAARAGANAAVFEGAFPGVDVEYVVLPDGVKETLVLRESSAPSEYTFRLRTVSSEKLRVEDIDGVVSIYAEGTWIPLVSLVPPTVGDSSGVEQTAPSSGAPSVWTPAPGKVSMRASLESDGGVKVVVSIDEKWLRATERVFPVILDPMYVASPDIADGYYDTTGGGTPVLDASINTGRSGAAGPIYSGVVSFDLGSIPPAAKVLDANLYMKLNACFPSACASGDAGSITAKRLTSSWSPSTPWASVTSDPAVLATVTYSGTPSAGGWQTWTGSALTSTVQSMVSGATANLGFLFEKSGSPSKGYAWRSSRYSDPADTPYIDVTWIADGVQVSPIGHLHSNGAELVWQHFSGGASDYLESVLTDAPLGYWRLGDGAGSTSAFDWSGNERHATTTGGVIFGTASALTDLDTAATFNGSSGEGNANGINVAGGSFTVEAWLKHNLSGTDDYAVGQGSNASNNGLHFGFRSSNAFTCAFYNNDLNTAAYTDTGWHHWACTYDAATNSRKIYRDGVLQVSDTASADYGGTGSLRIGNSPVSAFFSGVIDEVAVYPAALSAARLADHVTKATSPYPGLMRYEIHRSTTSGFTPAASTLIGTVADSAVTTWRDTSAKPGTTFYYEVVAVTSEAGGTPYSSNEVKAVLPATGHATVVIQPGFVSSRASGTYISSAAPDVEQGGNQALVVGATASNKSRTLLQFDTRDIPSGVTIDQATLELYALQTTTPIALHRVSSMWGESGTWNTRLQTGKLAWTTAGGDFDGTAVATSAGGSNQHADSWDVTSLVSAWVGGTQSYLGVLFKYANEGTTQPTISYAADAYDRSVALRPKLTVTYADGSAAAAPVTSITSLAPGQLVSGTVAVSASANDDGDVRQVEFFDGSASLGLDNAAPWSINWTVTGAVGSSHPLKAVATDDAGNATSAPAVTTVKVRSTSPTVSVSTGGTLPTVTASSTASDDVGVTKVEFLANGTRFATDTTSPYSVSWNTLTDTQVRGYDGSWAITAKAYDIDGNVTTSSASNVTVSNTSGTRYQATFSTSGVPQEMTWDPAAGTQQTDPIDVTVTNTSTSTWTASQTWLRYRWFDASGAQVTPASADVAIPSPNIAPAGVRTIQIGVQPPALPDGVDRSRYRLQIDLYNSATSSSWSGKGNQPFEAWVTVNRKTPVKLGYEKWHHYTGEELGGGFNADVNLASGDVILRADSLSQPGRGLNTMLSLTYNSRETSSVLPGGNGWDFTISGLTPLGARLDVHPNAADTLAGRTVKWIAFIDGDGTYHRFDGFAVTGGTAYDAPPGVFLYLRQYSTSDATKWWALTRPDRVTYFFDQNGNPTGVEDRNQNRLDFTLSTVPAGDDAYGAAKRITKVTDAAGLGGSPAPNRSFDIAYWTKAETSRPDVRGKVKRISDHSGHGIRFDYYDDGNLLRITEEGGLNADGSYLADRTSVFSYMNAAGTGPAIAAAVDRAAPDPQTAQATQLFGMIDPRGNETTLSYDTTAGATRWRSTGWVNRAGKATAISYNPGTATTTVAMPLARTYSYVFDSTGKVTSITDPVNPASTLVEWFPTSDPAENLVKKVTQPGGAFEQWTYNQNGYMLTHKDELLSETRLTYENVPVDADDVSGKWETGRTIPHLSQLDTKTSPRGVATTGSTTDYKWLYDYDASGNPTLVTDPLGKTHATVWNANGTVQKTTDALGRDTVYGANYDANGLPTQITDPAGGITRAGFNDRGNVVWVQDPSHASYSGGVSRNYRSYVDYDSFGRAGRASDPRSSAFRPGELIWSVTRYDANDNVVEDTNRHYGRSTGGIAPVTSSSFDGMDRETLATGPRQTSDGGPVQTATAYDDAGRVIKTVSPNGVKTTGSLTDDYATFTSYDKLDRVFQEWRFQVDGSNNEVSGTRRTTSSCYDLAGDLRSMTAPKGSGGSFACPAIAAGAYFYTSATHTTTFEYDAAHRLTKTTTPGGRVTQTGYDENGATVSTTNPSNHVTSFAFNDRGEQIQMVEPYDAGRDLTTQYEYDDEGNLMRLISPRAFDVAAGGTPSSYVEEYTYDGLNRLTRTKLPAARGTGYAAMVLGDGPAAYWRLNETSGTTAADASGNSLPLTLTNGPALNQAGPFADGGNTAAGFDGTNDYATRSVVTTTTGDVSLEAWAYWAGTSANSALIVYNGNSATNGYGVMVGNGSCGSGSKVVILTGAKSCAATGSSAAMPQNAWTHLVAVKSSGTWTLYVNGVSTGTGSSAPNAPTGSTVVAGSGGAGFAGTVDEPAIYTRALSAAEVKEHFDLGFESPQAYTHRGYDPNGNLTMVSLPTLQSDPSLIATTDKTTNSYWDMGGIYSTLDPSFPKVRFEQSAEGWETSRIPETSVGSDRLDLERMMTWGYTPDGLLRDLRDIGGQRAVYSYDADGNQTSAVEAEGLTTSVQMPLTVTSTFDQLGQLTSVKTPKLGSADFLTTAYTYDLHGLPQTIAYNREENSGGTQTVAPRVQTYAYSVDDEPLTQVDDFATSATGDDEKVTLTWNANGWEATRKLEAGTPGSGTVEQDTARGYFRNGLLKTLVSTDGAGTTLESHTLDYVQSGVFLNGNVAKDDWLLRGPDSGAPCRTSTCTATWAYDARGRVVKEVTGTGDTRAYVPDVVGNITQESLNGTVARSATYLGQQLTSDTVGGTTKRYLYDSLGNLDCVTTGSYSGGACPAPGSSLYIDNVYDYKNRLSGFRNYNLTTTAADKSDYTIDPLDRPVRTTETHGTTTTTTDIGYVGLSSMVGRETLTGGTSTTKSYAYDPLGDRMTLADSTGRFNYLSDWHGSNSLLLDQARVVKESYEFTAYGGPLAAVTKSVSGFNAANVPPRNPYRYTDKRLDSGSGAYDMGARYYNATIGRFIQRDWYWGSADNLGLASSGLTANRYSLAAGNPVSYVEIDGHYVACWSDDDDCRFGKPVPPGGGSAGEAPAEAPEPSGSGGDSGGAEYFRAPDAGLCAVRFSGSSTERKHSAWFPVRALPFPYRVSFSGVRSPDVVSRNALVARTVGLRGCRSTDAPRHR